MAAVIDMKTVLSNGVSAFIAKPKQLLIDGKWVPAASGRTFDVTNPATGKVIARVAEGDKEDVDRAVKAARKAFEDSDWSRMTPSQRGKVIWRIGDLIAKYNDELAELESLDNGKPISVAKAADVPLAADMFQYMAGWCTKIEGKTIPISVLYTPGVQYHSYTRPEPIGVVGQIIPWNFPLLMAAWKLAPMLATGCTAVLKVAEETPLSALRLGEIMLEAGLPNGVVNIITGFGETAGAALAAHPGIEIVLADTDLDAAIPGVASGIFFNHGQCCCAGSRLYAEKSVFDKVVEGVAKFANNIKVGPGLDPSTEMGPMVSDIQHARVSGYLDSGIKEGAKAVAGGKKREGAGYFIDPTVLINTKPTMKVIQEEIFGPVVCAMPFDSSLAEVIKQANDSVYGLASGVWTRNISRAHEIAAQLKAGTVWVNCYNIFDASLPFGGYKQSGWGREMGEVALSNYLETKAVTIRL